jgi:hypothetical protein
VVVVVVGRAVVVGEVLAGDLAGTVVGATVVGVTLRTSSVDGDRATTGMARGALGDGVGD